MLDSENGPTAELYHLLTLNVFWERIVAANFNTSLAYQGGGSALSPLLRLQVTLTELQEIVRLTPNNIKNRGTITSSSTWSRSLFKLLSISKKDSHG